MKTIKNFENSKVSSYSVKPQVIVFCFFFSEFDALSKHAKFLILQALCHSG